MCLAAHMHAQTCRTAMGSIMARLQTLRNEPVGYGADLWALGCLLYHMLVGKPPFREGSEYLTFQRILAGDLHMPDSLPEPARDLIGRLLASSPQDRPGAGPAMLFIKRLMGSSCRAKASRT